MRTVVPRLMSTTLTLTDAELKIFGLVKSACLSHPLKPVARVAGGWVRDKLIEANQIPTPTAELKAAEAVEGLDIDLAIDVLSGEEFAECVGVKFTCNPGQSKHLASAVLHFDDPPMKVDVNRLRKETYNDESRIPVEIQPGSELDDVRRRDFTINALYYNIITEQVEDLLNTGLQDLQNRIIRTPGNPKESICEDPLRIFRAIRFAARFDFALHEDLVSVIRDYPAPLILKKVSRERIAQEVFKALLISSDLGCALRTVVFLQELNLFAMVFEPKIVLDSGKELPVSPEEFQWTDDLISESVECVRGVVSARPSFNSRTFVLAAILWPIRNHEYELKKNKLRPLAEALLQYNCKQPIAIINEVIQILSAAQAFHALLKDFPADASSESKADVVFSNCGLETRVGHILRKSKEDWILALLIASRGYSHVSASLAKWIREESGLDGVWEWKPFFAGGALKELGVEGPQIGKFIEHQWEWRFSNPTASQQDCLNWLQTLLT